MYRCESCGNVERDIHKVVAPWPLPCCVNPVYVTVEEEDNAQVTSQMDKQIGNRAH